MQTDALITTLLSAAAFLKEPVRAIASQSLRDVYETTKYYLRRKFGTPSRGATALEMATDKPAAAGSRALLIEETASAGLEKDTELLRLVAMLDHLLDTLGGPSVGDVRIHGDGNRVQVAGSIVNTERHVTRNAITPDARHLDPDESGEVRRLVAEVADRMADESGVPKFAAVHRQLQRRFGVASYLLIPREQFAAAVSFLKGQRGLHRRRLRRRNPAAFEADLYRAIHAKCRELRWDREQLRAFAAEHLPLHHPLSSLRELGSNQLRTLLKLVQSQHVAAA